MDHREFGQRIKALQSCIAKNGTDSEIVTQINTIKKEASPTEEMLRTTRAGLLMGQLRKNSNRDIARCASEIVMKWKKMVEAEKAARGKASASPAPKPASSSSSSSTRPAPTSTTSRQKFTGDAEKRNFKNDGVDLDRTDSQIRNNCIGLIYNGLAFRSTESVIDIVERAAQVELSAFKFFKGETTDYKAKIRSLFQNLKVKTNAELGRSVMSGEIPTDRFVRMESDELMSAEMRRKNQELEKENLAKAQAPMAEKSISQELQCGSCKQKKVSYSQAQTRSADEPMTTFCECQNCGKRWKFS